MRAWNKIKRPKHWAKAKWYGTENLILASRSIKYKIKFRAWNPKNNNIFGLKHFRIKYLMINKRRNQCGNAKNVNQIISLNS